MNKPKTGTYGETLWEIRKKHHLTQTALSELIGVTPSYISKLENDRAKASKMFKNFMDFLFGNGEKIIDQ